MCLMIASSLTGCSMEAGIQPLKFYLNYGGGGGGGGEGGLYLTGKKQLITFECS